MRATFSMLGLLLGLGATMALFSEPPNESAHAILTSPSACSACHQAEAQTRWESQRDRPCTPFCLTCHQKEDMDKHHPVGSPVTKPARLPLRLTQDRRSACFTCHDLTNRPTDGVRWKAESLFGRMFRKESQYKTYYLVTRNDRGQLCLACH